MNAEREMSFRKRHTLQQRIEKSNKQMKQNPDKIVLIAQRHKKSKLPILPNQRFLCEKNYKFNMVKQMLQKKLKETGKVNFQGKNSFFIYINSTIPNQEYTMGQIYDKYKNQDGFLYVEYGDQESL